MGSPQEKLYAGGEERHSNIKCGCRSLNVSNAAPACRWIGIRVGKYPFFPASTRVSVNAFRPAADDCAHLVESESNGQRNGEPRGVLVEELEVQTDARTIGI